MTIMLGGTGHTTEGKGAGKKNPIAARDGCFRRIGFRHTFGTAQSVTNALVINQSFVEFKSAK